MAMTIEQQPAYKLQPAGSDWIFTISSTNVSGNYKYKFIIDLQIAQAAPSSNTIRLKVSPNDAGVGIINISSILQDYVNYDLLAYDGTPRAEFKTNDFSATNRFAIPLVDKISLAPSSVYRLNVKIGEEYSTTANGAPTLTAAVTALDDLVFYNGVSYNNEQAFTGGNYGLNPASWNSKNYVLDGTLGTALTNAPTESQYIGDDEYATLAHLNGWTGASVCEADRIVIKFYDSSNLLLQVETLDFDSTNGGYDGTGDTAFTDSPKHIQYIGVGPANIRGGGTSISSSWSYYTIEFDDSLGNNKSKTYKYIKRDADCKGYEKIRLCWINKFGVWDYYTFTKKSTKQTKINRNYYSSVKGNWNNSTFTKDGIDRGRGVVTTKATQSININSDWISTDEEAAWLEELFISPSVYIINDDDRLFYANAPYGKYMIPVVITNSDYQTYTRVNDKVSLYNIDLEYSIDTKVQKA